MSAALIGGVPYTAAFAQPFPASINLGTLDGENGFRLDGQAGVESGLSVSGAGDVNGDGIDDLLVGARSGSPGGVTRAGSTYVVFGRRSGFPAEFLLEALDGSNGFRIDGEAANDRAGRSVSAAGDFNGDGIDDLIVGAYFAESNSQPDAGAAYIVFGRSGSVPPTLALSSLDSSVGLRIGGIGSVDLLGRSVSGAGDFNGDGLDDVLIGAYLSDSNGTISGSSYVIFGRSNSGASSISVADLDGSNGLRIDGAAAGDRSGFSVSGAGDVNDDGIDDLIIGAWSAAPDGQTYAGSSYVVLGSRSPFSSSILLGNLTAETGFRIDGVATQDQSGFSVSKAGDFNGDGVDDVIIGASEASPNGQLRSGSSYVVFGRIDTPSTPLSLANLDESSGVRLDGALARDRSGYSVSEAGDINGDGIDDVVIGALGASPNGTASGSSFVVFGRTSISSLPISLATPGGGDGFRLDGAARLDTSGVSVSSGGDINGDGVDDLVIGAFGADPGGSSYVVFGRDVDGVFSDGFEQPE